MEKDIRREEIVIEEKLTSTNNNSNNNNNDNKPTSNKSFSEVREKQSHISSSETKMINSSSLQNESAESAAKVYIHTQGGWGKACEGFSCFEFSSLTDVCTLLPHRWWKCQ